MAEDDNFEEDFEDEEDEILSGSAEYSPKSDFSKPEVVKSQVMKCNETRSKEMRDGYFNEVASNVGTPIRSWVSDERKTYVSAVIDLKIILTPEIFEEEEFKNLIDEIEKQEEIIFKKYCYHPVNKVSKVINGKPKWVWEKTGEDSFIPKIGALLLVNDSKTPHSRFVEYKAGLWDVKVNQYWDEMVELYDEVFAELNRLIHLKNYFKQSVSF